MDLAVFLASTIIALTVVVSSISCFLYCKALLAFQRVEEESKKMEQLLNIVPSFRSPFHVYVQDEEEGDVEETLIDV